MFEFDKKQIVCTQGIASDLDSYLIHIMIGTISKMTIERDYLQVFEFQNLKGHTQVIIHHQDIPQFQQVLYLVDVPIEAIYTGKIFIIDNHEYISIMKAEEY